MAMSYRWGLASRSSNSCRFVGNGVLLIDIFKLLIE
jgi:hypothetical protein